MTFDEYDNIKEKLLSYENAFEHYGLEKQIDECKQLLTDLMFNFESENDMKQECLFFIKKYKHIRDRFNNEVY